MSFEHFFGHVAGESYRNDDGSDRQVLIPRCRVGDLLVLEHEPDNPHDINAIRVLRQNGRIGYLEREFAGEVVSRSAKGRRYHYGVALLILVEDHGTSDAEVANYAREVLSRDRQVAAPASEIPRTAKLDWFVVALVAVALAVEPPRPPAPRHARSRTAVRVGSHPSAKRGTGASQRDRLHPCSRAQCPPS